MNRSSASFHAKNEDSDHHADRGKHKVYSHVFENGERVGTYLPDFARDIDLRNSWREPGEHPNGSGFEQAAEALKTLVRWLIQADQTRPRNLGSIGRRAVALAFAICPGECGETWPTMLAAARELRCTRQSLSKYNAELSRLAHGRFARVGTFAGAEARKERSAISRRTWDRRGRKSPEELLQTRAAYEARKRQEQSQPQQENTVQPTT